MSNATTFVESEVTAVGQEIQVSGIECFPENRWREAVLAYLFGVWSNNPKVINRPKISFDGIVLRLDIVSKTYYAYDARATVADPAKTKMVDERYQRVRRDHRVLTVGCSQAEVENGLVRFVKDDKISTLVIRFDLPSAYSIYLRKTTRRGEFIITSTALMTMEQAMNS